MGKNDFDIDFSFDEDYNFDPKAFLGTEEYDRDIDLNAFSDEELGLKAPRQEEDSFDLDEDMDTDDFLNMADEAAEEEEFEEEFEEAYEETFEEETPEEEAEAETEE